MIRRELVNTLTAKEKKTANWNKSLVLTFDDQILINEVSEISVEIEEVSFIDQRSIR